MANAAIAMLEGWTITSVETIENYSRTDDTCLNILDEIKNITLSNSEDSADVTGKNDTVLFTIKKNKAVEGSGSSGYISGSLLSLQTGSDPVSGKIKFRKREVISFEDNATEVVTAETAVGTAGSELLNVLITIDGTTTKYEQASSEDASHVAYTSGTKKITLPTGITNAGTIEVVYEYEKDGASVGNSADTYGKTTHTFINALARTPVMRLTSFRLKFIVVTGMLTLILIWVAMVLSILSSSRALLTSVEWETPSSGTSRFTRLLNKGINKYGNNQALFGLWKGI